MAENYRYLVLDTIRVPEAKKICAQSEEYWEPLYLSTDWQPHIELSPIWVRIQPNSTVLKMWETNPDWAASGMVFTFVAETTPDKAIRSLKSNITITCEDGRLFLLRFYSPYTFSKIVEYGEQREIDSILGSAHSAEFSPLLSDTYSTSTVKNTNSQTSTTLLSTKLVEELLA